MDWDVVSAKVTGPLEFEVQFADGVSGKVIMRHTHLTGVFELLRRPEFFQQLEVTEGFVTWPGELDLAPDAMHEAIRENGCWVLD